MGDDFLVQKTASCLFYVSNHNHVLRRFLILFFPLCFPFKTLMISLSWPFFYSCIYCLFFMLTFTALLRLILSFKFPWYLPEKSGNICLFSVRFHLLYSGFLFCLTFFVEPSFKLSNSYSFIYSNLYIRYLFGYSYSFIHPDTYWFSSLFFELFSYSWFIHFIYSLPLLFCFIFWAV